MELGEDFSCADGHLGHVGKAVFGIAQRLQRTICLLNIGLYGCVIFDIFKAYHKKLLSGAGNFIAHAAYGFYQVSRTA